MIMEGVREYGEEMPVELSTSAGSDRPTLVAHNECGHNCTAVDLMDVLVWVRRNRPDLLQRAEILADQL